MEKFCDQENPSADSNRPKTNSDLPKLSGRREDQTGRNENYELIGNTKNRSYLFFLKNKIKPTIAGSTELKKKIVKVTATAISEEIEYFEKTSMANFSLNPNPAYVIGIRLDERIKGMEIIAE